MLLLLWCGSQFCVKGACFIYLILGKTGPTGIAVTGAGKLPCRHVIHVDMHKNVDWDKAIKAVLLQAASLGVKSIAFPALGTGMLVYSLAFQQK